MIVWEADHAQQIPTDFWRRTFAVAPEEFIPDLPAEYDRMPPDYDAAKSDVVRQCEIMRSSSTIEIAGGNSLTMLVFEGMPCCTTTEAYTWTLP